MFILSKILHILIKSIPFGMEIFIFGMENFILVQNFKIFGHLEVLDLLNVNSDSSSTILCLNLCLKLCLNEAHEAHSFENEAHFMWVSP